MHNDMDNVHIYYLTVTGDGDNYDIHLYLAERVPPKYSRWTICYMKNGSAVYFHWEPKQAFYSTVLSEWGDIAGRITKSSPVRFEFYNGLIAEKLEGVWVWSKDADYS